MKGISSRPGDLGARHAGPRGFRHGWLGLAWAALSVLNVAAIAAWPSWNTIPFHLIAIAFTVLYWLRIWPASPMLWGLGIVVITTVTGIGLDVLNDAERVEEMTEMPLMAAMFVVTVWHANRKITADHERHLIGKENERLLIAQRRFLQDASHHLRTPLTIALTHAELLARDLSGRAELRDIQVVIGEMAKLRRLSERLLVIAAAEDPDFLHPEPVALDRFAADAIRRWRPTAERSWQLGMLDAAIVSADLERLGLAVDALLENAVRHTPDEGVIKISVIRGEGGVVRMIVADTGTGIEASELPHIFERFRTGAGGGNGRGTRGTGLGLALVRAVAEAHGGYVQVRSVPGHGTQFELTLPAAWDEGAGIDEQAGPPVWRPGLPVPVAE
ncbi:MAG: HAMP domain-containing histidine kinase [Streptosporangiaceae bacterium]|nr:HAMP domain-containing histidine kinase [Streptosporangiaceae bacterium]